MVRGLGFRDMRWQMRVTWDGVWDSRTATSTATTSRDGATVFQYDGVQAGHSLGLLRLEW
jgi:hypothetical protein